MDVITAKAIMMAVVWTAFILVAVLGAKLLKRYIPDGKIKNILYRRWL
jgi:hypothetical protein